MVDLRQTSTQPTAIETKVIKPRRITTKRVLLGLVLMYVSAVAVVSLFQEKLIYHPSREIKHTPRERGLEYEDLKLQTADGVNISAWYVPHDTVKAHILFFHGNTGNIGNPMAELAKLHSLGYAVMLVDYHGYGQSEGTPSEQATYQDAQAAWNYLTVTRGIPAKSIVVMGESLGGGIAIDLASRVEPGALVTKSTFTSMADVGALHAGWLPVRMILRHRYDSIDKVPNIKCPKLIIHTAGDKLIPIAQSRKLFAAAAEPKQFMETPGVHHAGGFMHSAEFARQMDEFIRNALAN